MKPGEHGSDPMPSRSRTPTSDARLEHRNDAGPAGEISNVAGRLRVLYAGVFVVMTGFGITLTVLPDFTHRVHGLSGLDHSRVAVHLGVLTSVYALAQLLISPIAGRLADRVGRRPLLLGGLIIVGSTQLLFALAPSLWILYGLRAGGGVGASLLTVAATASIADLTGETSRVRGMAWFGTVVSLGLVAGPALGGVLSRLDVNVGRGPFLLDGYSLPFVVAGLLALAVAAATARAFPESLDRRSVGSRNDSRPWSRSPLRSLLMLVTASQFGLALFEGTFVLYARERLAFRPAQTSVVLVVCGAVMAVFQLAAVGRLARRFSASTQVAAGFALTGVATAALAIARSYPVVLSAVGILALGTAIVTPNLAALVSSHSGDRFGSALGLKSSAGSLGQFLGPMAGGLLQAWRPPMPYAFAGAILFGVGVATAAASARTAPTSPSNGPAARPE